MNKLVYRLSLLLIAGELVLICLSWLLSAMQVEGVRSLLSSEGSRWFIGQFSVSLLTPHLTWILLLSMAAGCLWRSGMLNPSQAQFRRAFALRGALVVMLVVLTCVVLLVSMPQAVLLSSTGHLWPSPFSRALVPILSMMCVMVSGCYGLLSRTFVGPSDIYASFVWGIQIFAPLLVFYIFFMQFYASFCYVFEII